MRDRAQGSCRGCSGDGQILVVEDVLYRGRELAKVEKKKDAHSRNNQKTLPLARGAIARKKGPQCDPDRGPAPEKMHPRRRQNSPCALSRCERCEKKNEAGRRPWGSGLLEQGKPDNTAVLDHEPTQSVTAGQTGKTQIDNRNGLEKDKKFFVVGGVLLP